MSQPSKINVMIVDDSAVIRNLYKGILESDKNINISATANNAQIAIDTLRRKKDEINIITLDIQMPDRDGISIIPDLLEISPNVKIIMSSTLSTKGAKETLLALEKGAVDYIAKPIIVHDKKIINQFSNELINKIKTFGAVNEVSIKIPKKATRKIILKKGLLIIKPKVLIIGSSTGGPQALKTCFKKLKNRKLYAPIFITQHMPASFTKLLAKQLKEVSGLNVAEGIDGEEVHNRVYLAPGGYHMKIVEENKKKIIRITEDPQENFCRPAVDYMLRSLNNIYNGNGLLMILTGMGADGCLEAKNFVDNGGVVIAQDEETSVVWGMPGAVAMEGICNYVLPLENLADKFIELSQGQIR